MLIKFVRASGKLEVTQVVNFLNGGCHCQYIISSQPSKAHIANGCQTRVRDLLDLLVVGNGDGRSV